MYIPSLALSYVLSLAILSRAGTQPIIIEAGSLAVTKAKSSSSTVMDALYVYYCEYYSNSKGKGKSKSKRELLSVSL